VGRLLIRRRGDSLRILFRKDQPWARKLLRRGGISLNPRRSFAEENGSDRGKGLLIQHAHKRRPAKADMVETRGFNGLPGQTSIKASFLEEKIRDPQIRAKKIPSGRRDPGHKSKAGGRAAFCETGVLRKSSAETWCP